MAVIKKLDVIKLPFVTINILDLKGHADVMENIPDFVTKIRYQVTNATKEPDGLNKEFEFGLSFTDIKPIPKHSKYVVVDYVKQTIEYHLYALTCEFIGESIENRTPHFDTGSGHMSRIMEIIEQGSSSRHPLILEYMNNGKPTMKFGIGRDILVQIVPSSVEIKVKSLDKNHPWSFLGLIEMGDDEPVIDGKITIFGEINKIYVWRKYNNKVFHTHALKEMLEREIEVVLAANHKLVDALGACTAMNLRENNTDRLLRLAP